MLDARLQAVYDLIGRSNKFADIGCDHGLLSAALLRDGKVNSAILADINRDPLENSRRTLARIGLLDRAEFVLSDGFSAIPAGSFDKAAICGMGGLLIARILQEAGEKAHGELVLQPVQSPEKLRLFLWENGFTIEDEQFACLENSASGLFRAYVAMKVQYRGENTPFTFTDLYLGKVRPESAGFAGYCEKIAIFAADMLRGAIHRGEDTAELESLLEQAKKPLRTTRSDV